MTDRPDPPSGPSTSATPGTQPAVAYAPTKHPMAYGPAYEPLPSPLAPVLKVWKEPAQPLASGLFWRAMLAGLVGAIVLGTLPRNGFFGLDVLFAFAAVASVAVSAAWPVGRIIRPVSSAHGRRGVLARFNRTGAAFAFLAFALVAVVAFLDAGWLIALCLLLAVPIGSYAASGGRSWVEVLGGGLALPPAALRMIPWTVRGMGRATLPGRGTAWPIIRTALIVAVLLLVFGGLFAGADAAFRKVVGGLMPEISAGGVTLRLFLGGVTAACALAAAFLAQAPPPLHKLGGPKRKPAGRWAWAVPIVSLDLLFLFFCALQASVLLASDKDRLLRSTGLTYAEYAREGFFQLVVVTVLVLVVLALAARYAPSGGRGDRTLVRVLLGVLCALTLVVVAVALRRLFLYEETYGWTRLRIWVHAFELWLGVVIVLIAAAGLTTGRIRVTWLPRAIAASGAAGLLLLAAVNPDGFIADRNVDRFERTGKMDVIYAWDLSADAVPALDRLPEPHRSCALRPIARRLERDEPLLAANVSRARAREILERHPVGDTSACVGSWMYR
jgi:hypothetical protein